MKMDHSLEGHYFLKPAVLLLFFISLFFLSFVLYWRQAHTFTSEIIVEHIQELSNIFEKINEDCGILSFEHQKNYIDFLTVKSFVGSEVGSMNLTYPDKWQGPYLNDNPTVQEKYYQVVRTQGGHYIVPGEGVILHNGKKIGEDILFDEDVDIEALIADKTLQYQGQPLAARIAVAGESHRLAQSAMFDEAE